MDDVVADKSNRSDGTRLKRNVILVTKKRGCCGREGDALQHKRYCLQSSSHIWREIRHTPPPSTILYNLNESGTGIVCLVSKLITSATTVLSPSYAYLTGAPLS